MSSASLDQLSQDEHVTAVLGRNAQRHFDKTMALCCCNLHCDFDRAWETSLAFAKLSESERTNAVRSMLLALTASNEEANFLLKSDGGYAQERKKKRRTVSSSGNTTTSYAMRGRRVCKHAFAAIVQLHPRTVNDYAREVSQSDDFTWNSNAREKSHKGRFSPQTKVAVAFLIRYGELNAMSCPTGRGSKDETPVRWLPNDIRREVVYESYRASWSTIIDGYLVDVENVTRPEAPLTQRSFCALWRLHCPTLKVLKRGSDFCDTCTELGNYAATLQDVNTKRAVVAAREKHREQAKIEYTHYCDVQKNSGDNPRSAPLHFVFDFAEKILLPQLLRHPGQLHFVTGLKFDINGIYCSNMNKCYIFGLPEGH